MRKEKIKKSITSVIFFSILSTFLSLTINQVEAAANTKSQTKSIEILMRSFASAKPEVIFQARKNHVVPNSSADIFAEMVEKHFSGTQYLKTQDQHGNTSPTAPDLPGKLKLNKTRTVYELDSTFDRIDAKYQDFKFNKKGKITSFSVGVAGKKPISIKNDISRVTSNFKDSGVTILSGIHWNVQKTSNFIQLNFRNEFAGPRSWSYAKGWVRDADGINHSVTTGPLGCTQSGGGTVIEAQTVSGAKIIKGTTNVLIVPMFKDCFGNSYDPVYVSFLVN